MTFVYKIVLKKPATQSFSISAALRAHLIKFPFKEQQTSIN